MQPPFTLEVEPYETLPGQVVLHIRTRHVAPLPVDIGVSVQLPPGVRLEGGPGGWEIPTAQQQGIVEKELVIGFDALPPEDLMVVADVQTEGFGVHAKAYYRFGRPDPQPIAPRANGPELKVGGRNFGRSVTPDQ